MTRAELLTFPSVELLCMVGGSMSCYSRLEALMVHHLSDKGGHFHAKVVTRAFRTAVGRGAGVLPGTFRFRA